MPKNNLFKPSFGNRPDRVVGRDQLISQIYDGLQDSPGSKERAVLMLGQRGMGKTSMLLEIADRAADLGYVPVRVTARASMLDDIVGLTQVEGAKAFGMANSRISSLSAGAFGFSVGLTFTDEVEQAQGFRVKLGLLCDRLAEAGLGLLILLDEVQPNTEEMRSLATIYQELAGEEKNIAIVMAGLPSSVSKVLNERTLTFLNRARRMQLDPISTTAVRLYYEDAFARMGRSALGNVAAEAAEVTRGIPYLLQLIGYYLVQYSDMDGAITEKTLAAAREMALEDLRADVFETSLKQLSEKDLQVLRAMTRDEGTSRVADLLERLGIDDSHFQPYRARLLATGLVDSPRRGELRFTVPYLAEYLAEE